MGEGADLAQKVTRGNLGRPVRSHDYGYAVADFSGSAACWRKTPAD